MGRAKEEDYTEDELLPNPKAVELRKSYIKRTCLGPECHNKFKTKNKFQRLCETCRQSKRYNYLRDHA